MDPQLLITDPDPTFQSITDPDPTTRSFRIRIQIQVRQNFLIRADPDPQHYFNHTSISNVYSSIVVFPIFQ